MANDDDELTKRILGQREETNKLIRRVTGDLHRESERARLTLGPSHERILEYFWNSKTKQEHPDLPISVVHFFESADAPDQRMLSESGVDLAVAEMVVKGYVERSRRKPDRFNFMARDEEILTLTPQGLKYLLRRHPQVFVWWTKILDATPSYISLTVALIGLVAAVLGIIDFIGKVRGHGV